MKMVATNATLTRKAAPRQDTVETLVAKITATIGKISSDQGKSKDILWKRMQGAIDAGNRDELIGTLSGARFVLRRQVQFIEVVLPKWQEAMAASTALVKTENAAGHKGQQLFDVSLRDDFVAMNVRVSQFLAGRERIGDLIADLEDLIFQTGNFTWEGRWCRCGAPIPTEWKWCRGCYKPRYTAEVSDAPVKPSVKKPGSAARHGQGHPINEDVRPRDRKMGKGKKK